MAGEKISNAKYQAKSDAAVGLAVGTITGALTGISVFPTKHIYTYHLEFPSLNPNKDSEQGVSYKASDDTLKQSVTIDGD